MTLNPVSHYANKVIHVVVMVTYTCLITQVTSQYAHDTNVNTITIRPYTDHDWNDCNIVLFHNAPKIKMHVKILI